MSKVKRPEKEPTKRDMLELLMLVTDAIAPIRQGKRDGGTFGSLSIIDDEIRKMISKAMGGAK
jgi:hypothetical protein